MSYQKVTGTVNAGAHPGSYNGQDAYNDMLVIDEVQNDLMRRGGETAQTLDASYFKGTGARNGKEREVIAEEPIMMSDRKGHNGITEDGTATTLTAEEKDRPLMATSIVRRLTPLECERLQGMPSTKMWDVSKMTHDEYIAWNLAVGHIIVQPETGKVFRTRGPGGVPYKEPRELKGYVARGYLVINICNGATKMLCRVNRVVWISQNGIIPPGYVVDHINNNKLDNRIQNLQLLTPEENSTKAHDDGLYKCGLDTKATKLDPALHEEIAYLYTYTDITQKKLAEIYGVSKSRISQIIQDIGWSKYGINEKGEVYELPDSARYRLQGNGIATPFWKYLLKRISAQYERDPTMGSLFAGQGSFEYLWTSINGIGTVPWSSEIDKHGVAVITKHFGDEERGIEGDIRQFL